LSYTTEEVEVEKEKVQEKQEEQGSNQEPQID
jgi:hypothetical protein